MNKLREYKNNFIERRVKNKEIIEGYYKKYMNVSEHDIVGASLGFYNEPMFSLAFRGAHKAMKKRQGRKYGVPLFYRYPKAEIACFIMIPIMCFVLAFIVVCLLKWLFHL